MSKIKFSSIVILVTLLFVVTTNIALANPIKFDAKFLGTFGLNVPNIGVVPAIKVACTNENTNCVITTLKNVNGKVEKLQLQATIISTDTLSFTNLKNNVVTWQFSHVQDNEYKLNVTQLSATKTQTIFKVK